MDLQNILIAILVIPTLGFLCYLVYDKLSKTTKNVNDSQQESKMSQNLSNFSNYILTKIETECNCTYIEHDQFINKLLQFIYKNEVEPTFTRTLELNYCDLMKNKFPDIQHIINAIHENNITQFTIVVVDNQYKDMKPLCDLKFVFIIRGF